MVGPGGWERWKREGRRIVMLTAYDYPAACWLEAAGVDLALVGDSLGTNVLGYASVHEVTLADMAHHVRAVSRGLRKTALLADLPFGSYRGPGEALASAAFLRDAGAVLVKLEGGREVVPQVSALVAEGHRVVAHIGYRPQLHREGEAVVKGRTVEEACDLLADAEALEAAGAEMVLMECVAGPVASAITRRLTVPTIGIGSGPDCDGQVLVLPDVLGVNEVTYRFVRRFGEVGAAAGIAIAAYRDAVRSGSFPVGAESFKMPPESLAAFSRRIGISAEGDA